VNLDVIIELTDAQVEQIAEHAAELLAERPAAESDGWLRGAERIAAYIDCPRSRIYALTSAGRIPVERDGASLIARRSAYRLLELDRATVPTDTLAAKLARHADLCRHTPTNRGQPSRKPAWQARYPIFPDIICVLAGQPRPTLRRRAQTVLALCSEDPRLANTPEIRISLTLLEDLQTKGPHAPIWLRPENPSQTLDWLGK
jgi:hypothetical protein